MTKLRLSHDSSGIGAAWQIHSIELHDFKEHLIYTCEIDQWLKKTKGNKRVAIEAPVTKIELIENGKRKVIEELSKEEHLVNYSVAVHTSDIWGAGTDANVYMILYGEEGDTGERHLNNSLTNRFVLHSKNMNRHFSICLHKLHVSHEQLKCFMSIV